MQPLPPLSATNCLGRPLSVCRGRITDDREGCVVFNLHACAVFYAQGHASKVGPYTNCSRHMCSHLPCVLQVCDRNVENLSGGELQRFAIAVVAAQEAQVREN